MNSQFGKSIHKENSWAPILCAALTGTYFVMLCCYGVNVPLWDDYYDILYFLHTYLQAEGVGNKFATLFWQYTEHRNPLGRLIYLGDYYLFGELDFFRMCVIGTLFLVMLAWVIGQLPQRHELAQVGVITSAHVISFALLLSMGMWQGTFWAMNAISVILFITIIFSIFLLLKQKTVHALAGAMALMALLMTMGLIGLITLLFTVFYTLSSQRSLQQKKVWLAFSLLTAFIFLFTYTDYLQLVEYNREDTLRAIAASPISFLLTAFGFIGGLPFADGDSLWAGATLGVLLIFASGHVLHRYWFADRQHFYLLFSLWGLVYTLMLAACIGRYLYMGEFIAYASRYKQYPAIVTSLILISYLQLYPTPLVRHGIVALALALTVNGYVRFLPQAIEQCETMQEKITRWAADGSHQSLGVAGIAPYAEQILFWAIDTGLYDPYRQHRAIAHQHLPPLRLSQCPMAHQTAAVLDAFVLNQPHSLGARLMLYNRDAQLKITTLYLCSEQTSYQLDAVAPANELSIQKALLAPGHYRLFFVTAEGEYRAINQTLMLPPHRERAACDTLGSDRTVTFSLEVRRVFCQ